MTKKHSIVPLSIAGGYWTGSSAVVDLLAEHSECTVIPKEFTLFSFGQFFDELYSPLIQGKFDKKTFDENVRRMIDFNRSDLPPGLRIMRRLFNIIEQYPFLFFNHRTDMGRRLGTAYAQSCKELIQILKDIRRDKSISDVKAFQNSIKKILDQSTLGSTPDKDKDNVRVGVFDQLVAPPYIDSAKLAVPDMLFINIDRDWRDQYISLRGIFLKMMRRNRQLRIRPWAEDLNVFDELPIPFFLRLRRNIDKIKAKQKSESKNNILWINYEDVVLKKEASAEKIFEFLQLDPKNWSPNQHFFPEISKKRIGKWKKGDWVKGQLKDEIDFLAHELGTPQVLL